MQACFVRTRLKRTSENDRAIYEFFWMDKYVRYLNNRKGCVTAGVFASSDSPPCAASAARKRSTCFSAERTSHRPAGSGLDGSNIYSFGGLVLEAVTHFAICFDI